MRPVDAATRWSLGLWFMLGLVPTVGQSMGWHALLNHQGLAAWVQAVGSIAAIPAAAAIAGWQASAAQRQELQRKVDAELQRLMVLNVIVSRGISAVRELKRREAGLTQPQFVNAALLASKQLEALKSSFLALPLFEIPSANLAVLVTSRPQRMEELVAEVARGSGVFNMLGSTAGDEVFEDVDATIAALMTELSLGQLFCEHEIKARGGTPIIVTGKPTGVAVLKP